MAQLTLGKVVPDIEITEVDGGKSVKFTTPTQEIETTIKDGEDGFSPIATMSTTSALLTISIKDAEGTKTQTVEKGTAVYCQSEEPLSDDVVVWIPI